ESGNITIDYNLSQRVFLEDGEDIEVNGVIWDDWEVIFHIVDTCANASIDPDFDSDGPECEILEYNEMDPLTTDGLLQEIEIIYGHKLDGVEALEKGESLEFPGGEVRLKFKGYTNENYLESPCSGGREGNIQIEPGDENYQMTISFTGEDGNRYDDIRLDEGPFGKGNYFIVGGVLYVYDKYKTLDNEEGMDSDDQIKVALFPPINGNEQSILLDRLCDPEDEQGTAPGCDYITTFCDCEDVPEEITVRTIALTDAMDDDDEEDMENDDEIEIAIEDIFYKDNAINGLTMLFDGSRLITFLDNLSDTYITVNPNMVGIFGDFERNDHNLYLWIEHECDLTRDLNSTDDNTATCDENGDGDDDDILVGFVHGNGERAIIDLSDRNYNAIETFDYDNGVALFESTTHIVTLDENIDSVLITPQGGDSYTLGWSTNNRLDLVGLCHPIDDVKPTLFLGTTENEIYGPKGDLDGDGTVSDYELLDYIDLWGGGEVADYDLLEVIDNWSG
ncbi:MAG: hypothetical protein L6243_01810, partial [Candidatus Altiarchaeales archaeon]|nr:hypothetical protein [Candidatus Altiarchaeota archaeon]MCG2782305.1 hypothetical protein [Candidatus Altiarchaeales archaeon]